MPLIDDEGNLLGIVNVIDVFVVGLLLAVVVAGVVIVSSGGDSEPEEADAAETVYATIELTDQPEYFVERIGEGDTVYAWGWGETYASGNFTVTDIHTTPSTAESSNSTADMLLLMEFEGVPSDHGHDEILVDGEPLPVGAELELWNGAYATDATVLDLTSDDPALPVEETTTTVDIELRDVHPAVAAAFDEGMSETVHGETIATIESIESEPATVVAQSQNGSVHEREHPRNVDVTLTVELQATETENGLHFRGEPLRIGSEMSLDFDIVVADGEVIDVE